MHLSLQPCLLQPATLCTHAATLCAWQAHYNQQEQLYLQCAVRRWLAPLVTPRKLYLQRAVRES